jgi:hypothetical protein
MTQALWGYNRAPVRNALTEAGMDDELTEPVGQ